MRRRASPDAILLLLALAAGCTSSQSPTPDAAPDAGTPEVTSARCDLAAHVFEQRSGAGYCDRSLWRFAARPDGRWNAAETGCADATGIATYDEATVVLDFVYDGGGSTGRYTWPLDGQCRGSAGTVQWITGPVAGQSTTSTLAISGM
jgi:hypothetical protein